MVSISVTGAIHLRWEIWNELLKAVELFELVEPKTLLLQKKMQKIANILIKKY